jgi:hypothetical protein
VFGRIREGIGGSKGGDLSVWCKGGDLSVWWSVWWDKGVGPMNCPMSTGTVG